ncbi:MAG: hypothetical protein ACOYYS_16090 [Chloroflexota bacterium]
MDTSQLPITRNLASAHTLSLVVALLFAATSLVGLLLPESIYPTDELRRAFLANDVVNLLIGLPMLLGSLWLVRRDRWLGLLFWPGALFYVAYNAIAYAVAMPLTVSFVANLALALLSVLAIANLLGCVDPHAVASRLGGHVPERLTGGVLAGFGALFFLMAVGEIAAFADGQSSTPWAEVAVRIADLLVTPVWVAGGILLWRKKPLGYAGGLGLLFQASMLFVGLLVFFILQPFVAGVPFPAGDFVVIAVMSLICFLPFGLFVRGVLKAERLP